MRFRQKFSGKKTEISVCFVFPELRSIIIETHEPRSFTVVVFSTMQMKTLQNCAVK